MKITNKEKKKFRVRNHLKKVSSSDRYRLTIFRSSKNFSAQIIDDINKKTLISASSLDKDLKKLPKTKKTEVSINVANKIATMAGEKNIKKIYLDRGVYKYHGRVKIFAETLREKGLEF